MPRRGEQIAEHRELVEALLRASQHLARQIATEQIETSRKRVMEALLGEMSEPNGNFNSAGDKTRAGLRCVHDHTS